jgi:hypothetical protein
MNKDKQKRNQNRPQKPGAPFQPILGGETFGALTATGHSKPGDRSAIPRIYPQDEVECECGWVGWIHHSRLMGKKPQQSCSNTCLFNSRKKPPVKGEKFHHLTATGKWKMETTPSGFRYIAAEFVCDCGRPPCWKSFNNVKFGQATSCDKRCSCNGLRIGDLAEQRDAYRNYKRACLVRNFVPLTFEDWLSVAKLSCIYCGALPTLYKVNMGFKGFDRKPFFRNGIDHFDPKIKAPVGNSLPCCLPCNHEKNVMTPQEWKDRLIQTRGKTKATKIWRRVKAFLRKQKEQ